MIRRPPRSPLDRSSAASDVYKRQPLALVAWLLFGLQLPAEPVVWAAAAVTLLLGHTVMFGFDWILACAAFYTTDAWGLATARQGFVLFFSGMLLPLAIMPQWLRTIAGVLPFSPAGYLLALIHTYAADERACVDLGGRRII